MTPIVKQIKSKPEGSIKSGYTFHEYKLCRYSLTEKGEEWLNSNKADEIMKEYNVSPDDISKLQEEFSHQILSKFHDDMNDWAESLTDNDFSTADELDEECRREALSYWENAMEGPEIYATPYNLIPILSRNVEVQIESHINDYTEFDNPFYDNHSNERVCPSVREKYEKLVEGQYEDHDEEEVAVA